MGDRSRGILLMRLLLVYLKIDLSIRDVENTQLELELELLQWPTDRQPYPNTDRLNLLPN